LIANIYRLKRAGTCGNIITPETRRQATDQDLLLENSTEESEVKTSQHEVGEKRAAQGGEPRPPEAYLKVR